MSDGGWNDNYARGFLPWDTGVPCPHLVDLIGELPRGRALEIGCGTGTNAVWLAHRGYRVVAVDVAPLALERARERAEREAVEVDWRRADVLVDPIDGGPFDLVFDRGVFHVFDRPEDRARFASRVAEVLAPGGRWLSLVGSTEGPPRTQGPPRRSLRDLAGAIEPSLEILEVRGVGFGEDDGPNAAPAWRVLSRLREVPAQPSTTR